MRYHAITCTRDCDGWPCECWCHDDADAFRINAFQGSMRYDREEGEAAPDGHPIRPLAPLIRSNRKECWTP